MKPTVPVTDAQAAAADSGRAQLKGRVISGTVWTVGGYGAGQLMRLAGNLALARLLFPEAFGLMALVSVFIQGLTMFSDIGIGPSIIQSKRGEDLAFLNTAWTIQAVRGVLLWLASVLLAGPFADWYGEPELASLIRVSALASILSGFISTKFFSGSRRISLARITVIDFASQTIGLIVSVAWCFVTKSVWAIVYGSLVSAATKTLLSHAMLKGERNRFTIDRTAFHELMSFGRWIFLSTALSFLTWQVDRLMLGKLETLGNFGVYSIAMSLATLTPAVALTLTGGVLFPLLAHHSRTDAKAYEGTLFAARGMLLKGAAFVLGGLALVGPVFFGVLYDERYIDAAWIAPLLTVPMWIWMLMLSADRAVLAVGESRTLAISNGASLLVKLGGCLAGFHWFGLTGFIFGLAAGNLAGHIPIVLALRRIGINILRQDLACTGVAVLSVGGGVLVQRLVMTQLDRRWLTPVQLLVALVVLVPLGWQAVKQARLAMAKK